MGAVGTYELEVYVGTLCAGAVGSEVYVYVDALSLSNENWELRSELRFFEKNRFIQGAEGRKIDELEANRKWYLKYTIIKTLQLCDKGTTKVCREFNLEDHVSSKICSTLTLTSPI